MWTTEKILQKELQILKKLYNINITIYGDASP